MAYKSMLILSVLLITTVPSVHGSAINNVAQLNVLCSLFGELVTNATGFVDSVVKLADGISFDPSVCYLEVGLPVGGCTVLPPNGVLRAPVSVVSIVQTTVGAVVRVVGGLFAHA